MKPPACAGCDYADKDEGFSKHDGAVDAPLLVIAEAPGKEEIAQGQHLVGPAGGYHWRQAKRAGVVRSNCRVGNVVSCRPPLSKDGYDTPPNDLAIRHCRVHREPLYRENHKAILTLGVTATRETCAHFGIDYYGSLDHWRGYVIGDGSHPWIIPAYHPSAMLRGNFKYTGVYIHDVAKAWEVATTSFTRSKVDLIADPSVEWFDKWSQAVTEDTWLGVDIETPEPQDANDPNDASWRILYVNFSYSLDEGISVPYEGPYISIIKRMLERSRWQWYWNAHYDVKRLKRADHRIPWYYDAKDAWHVLQSDMGEDDKAINPHAKKNVIMGNSLGFAAPHYSDLPPWKHLPTLSPYYRTMDGVQTTRVAHGIAADLMKQGQWETFLRHFNLFDHRCLRPAEAVGLLVNRPRLEAFGQVLHVRSGELEKEIQESVPDAILPLKKPSWKRPPEGYQDAALPTSEEWTVLSAATGPGAVLGRLEPDLVKVCKGCGAYPVTASHKKCASPRVELEEMLTPRWTMRLPFNPASPDQIRALILHAGLNTGRGKKAKTDKMTTEAGALEKLAKKIPVLAKVLDRRGVEKTDGTYVSGILGKLNDDGTRRRGRLGEDNRIHTTFLHVPSTLRLSSVNPNLTNVVHGDEEEGDVELPPWDPSGFRRAVVAAPGCVLYEFDYSAIEAVVTGWFCGDPDYMRLARAGVHAYLTAVGLKAPGIPKKDELSKWSTADLQKLLKPFKTHRQYKIKKRVVHGVSYGLTAFGMAEMYPDLFPTRKSAQDEIDFFFSVCPKVQVFQNEQRNRANRLGFLGGSGGNGEPPHPFRYKHWFFDVVNWDARYKKWKAGSDANRVVAFKPQSTARGILTEAALELFDAESENYVGDFYYGETPLRAFIHDSGLYEVPIENEENLKERVVRAMTKPVVQLPCPKEWGFGEYLSIGVAAKRGFNWAPKSKHNPEGMEEVAA